MFGGAFSTTWAAQQQAEADELMNNIRIDKYGRISAEDDIWGSFVLETIELDRTTNSAQGLHWLSSFAHLLAWGVENFQNVFPKNYQLESFINLQKELPNGHPLKSAKIINMDHEHSLIKKVEEISKNIGALDKLGYDLKINLSNLNFTKEAIFSNFIFPIDVDFSNTKFFQNVYFIDTVFCETAEFEDAEFQEKKSHSKETAKFRNTVFKKIANFRNATFWGYANFKGSKLEGRAFFQDAKFKCHAPRFYDATFNNEITWAGIKLPYFTKARVDKYKKVKGEFIPISDRKFFTRIKHRKIIKKNHRRRIEENQNSYENTSILLKEANRYHDQHFFFRQEMRCRRWLGNFFNCSLYWLYQLSSDYGYGVGLALACWALHIILGVGALMFFISPSWEYANPEFQKILDCAMPVSFANANPYTFFGFENDKLTSCYTMLEKRLPIGSGVIQIVQSIAGTLFLFLLLLTLRVRFRLNSTTSNTTIKATINTTSEK